MSKYDNLWNWIKENGRDSFKLTYEEVEKIAGLPLDHSFLKYKKELIDYGYEVVKISMKEQTVAFRKIEPEKDIGNRRTCVRKRVWALLIEEAVSMPYPASGFCSMD